LACGCTGAEYFCLTGLTGNCAITFFTLGFGSSALASFSSKEGITSFERLFCFTGCSTGCSATVLIESVGANDCCPIFVSAAFTRGFFAAITVFSFLLLFQS